MSRAFAGGEMDEVLTRCMRGLFIFWLRRDDDRMSRSARRRLVRSRLLLEEKFVRLTGWSDDVFSSSFALRNDRAHLTAPHFVETRDGHVLTACAIVVKPLETVTVFVRRCFKHIGWITPFIHKLSFSA